MGTGYGKLLYGLTICIVAYRYHRLGHGTTVLHGVAAHCSHIYYFTEYFSVLLSASSAYVSQYE